MLSYVDSGNTIYIGLNLSHGAQLQYVLNTAVRLIGGMSRFAPISFELRWLIF